VVERHQGIGLAQVAFGGIEATVRQRKFAALEPACRLLGMARH